MKKKLSNIEKFTIICLIVPIMSFIIYNIIKNTAYTYPLIEFGLISGTILFLLMLPVGWAIHTIDKIN